MAIAGTQYAALSTECLLQKLLGVRESRRLYQGELGPLFSPEDAPDKCAVARELVKRWLEEDLARGCVLSKPEAVRDYLYTQHQIPLHKISVFSFGEEKPVVPNNTKDGRAQNRRVVIRVLS